MRQLFEYSAHSKPVFELRPNVGGSHFLSFGLDGLTILWETRTGRQIHAFRSDNSAALAPVVFSPDGTRIAEGRMDGRVVLFDLTTLEETNVHSGHTGPVRCIAFSPDGKRLASGGEDGKMRLWKVDDALEEIYFESFQSAVTGTEFSPAGDVVLVCLRSCEVFEWNIQRCQKTRDFIVSGAGSFLRIDV